MILHELKKEVDQVLCEYVRGYPKRQAIPRKRQEEVDRLCSLLGENDALVFFKKLIAAVDALKLPIIDYFFVLSPSHLYWSLKRILMKEKYQPPYFFEQVVREHQQIIMDLKRSTQLIIPPVESSFQKDIQVLATEVRLLRSENQYLYKALQEMGAQMSMLERQSATHMERATQLEAILLSLSAEGQVQSNNLSVFSVKS